MTITIPTPPDFSFTEALSAHGWRQLAPFAWDDASATLSRVERLADESVVALSIRADGDQVTVDTDAPAAALAEIEVAVRRMLQLDLPVNEFHAFCAEHAALAGIPGKRQGRMLVSPTVWEDVVKVITTTNTTWSQTKGMVARIVDGFGSALPSDPARRAFPTAAQIAATPLAEFAAVARLGYRDPAVHWLATEVAEGRLDLEAFRDPAVPTADLMKRLVALKGVGPYAASCLMIYLGRYERVNVDSWARMMVGKQLGQPVTDKEVHEFFAPYGKWQALVYHFYPWREAEPEY